MDRILVVHRDRQTLEGMERRLLERADHQVTLADGIDSALEALTATNPDLVLLCLPLSTISGRDAVASFHSVEPKMPVVVLSSTGGADETIQVIKAGAFDCLLEPYDDDELFGAISQGLEAITNRVVRQTVAEALNHTDGNRSRAARLLGVSRPTLLAKMRKHRLS